MLRRESAFILCLALVLSTPGMAQIRFTGAPVPVLPSVGAPGALSVPASLAPAGSLSAPEALPNIAPLQGEAPLSAPLHGLPAADENGSFMGSFSAKDGSKGQAAAPSEGQSRLGQLFDGAALKAKGPAAPVDAAKDSEGGEDGPLIEVKEEERPLELRFLGAHSKSILKSERTTSIRLVRDTEGSKRYWAKFKQGAEISVLASGQLLMKTTVKRGVTKRISQLTKADLVGMFEPAELNILGIRDLRRAVLQNLNSFRGSGSIEAPVSLDSKVRVIQFKSFGEIHKDHLPPEPVAKGPRPALKISEKSPLHQLNEILPRVVLLDLDLYADAVPSDILEDMSQLMRTGVTFIGLSRRSTPEAVAALTKNMNSFQRDVLLPYRFLMMSENGSVVSSFAKGGKTRAIEDAGFTENETEIVRSAVRTALTAVGKASRSLRQDEGSSRGIHTIRLSPGVDAPAFQKALQDELKLLGQDFKVVLTSEKGENVVRVYKTDLASSMGRLSEAMNMEMSVFALPSDMLALTDDAAVTAALPGSPDLSKAAPGLKGPELVDNVMGAILGEHREHREGDLAGSASRLGSFLKHHAEYLDQYVLRQEESMRNIHFFSGHMVHKALDWAVFMMRQGKTPTEAEVSTKLHEFWEAEDRGGDKPVGMPPGHTMDGMLEASKARTVQLYRHVTELASQGYKMVGTEIPNFFVLKSYDKKGELRRRYLLHTIFDLVAMKPTGKGTAELVILDFKSGPPQTMQKLGQDLQVLMYSLFLRYKWANMTLPYQMIGGKKYKIEKANVEFLYSPVRLRPKVNAWDLAKVEKKIIRTMDRMQAERDRINDPAAQKMIKKILKRAKAFKKAMGRK